MGAWPGYLLFFAAWPLAAQTGVSNFGANAQHTGNYQAAAQNLNTVHWSTSLNLANTGATIHYGAPLISAGNTVLAPVKTANGFQMDAVNGATGAPLYQLSTDYVLPNYNWIPSYGPALAGTRLYYPGAGGTVYYVDDPDAAPTAAPVQVAFYGLGNYQANPAGFNTTVFIDTPLTADTNGNVFFGFRVQGTAPAPLNTAQSGFARIDAAGKATYVLAGAAANNTFIARDSHNSAPGLSNDQSTLYVIAKAAGSDSYAYLLGLDSTTLATKYRVLLTDPVTGNPATVTDDSTASPTIAPDGDVYLGVLGNPDNGYRGYLLRFSSDLSVTKTPGAFGWDSTPAIVPASMVTGYNGPSTYLIFTKYNNYAVAGGDGVNRIALLDPNGTQIDPHPAAGGLLEMREVLTVIGPSPDPDDIPNGYPLAVHEWCVNSAAVNPASNSIFVPSEDGHLYRWDLSSNALSQAALLGPGVGAAYVPVVIGPDGTVYTIAGGNLFAIGNPSGVGVTLTSSMPDTRYLVAGQNVSFTATVSGDAGATPSGTVTFYAQHFEATTPVTIVLATNVPLDGRGVATINTATLTAGGNFITANYSGDAGIRTASATTVAMVHASPSITSLVSSVNPSMPAQTVTFTATVAGSPGGAAMPTGMVTFQDGPVVVAQVPLSAGTASFASSSFATSTMGPGNHTITATYASDRVFAASYGSLVESVSTTTALPTASNVMVAGANYPGQSLAGRYSYQDAGGAAEGGSHYRWLRDGSAIQGATGIGYAPESADVSHALTFEVTPVTVNGVAGIPVESTPVLIARSQPAGLLTGSGNSASNPVNLSAEGTADWIQWENNTVNRKATGGSQLSTFTIIGNSSLWLYNNDPRALSWSGGTPVATAANDTNGVYLPNSVGFGFSFTAPADTTVRTLVVHAGGYFSACQLTAHLSDSSSADYVDTTVAVTAVYDRNYVLTYSAASAGQHLTVSWVETTNLGAGNVNLSAAALSIFSGSVTASGGNSQSAAAGHAFGTPLQATVSDVNNNPVSGATVTFTMPSGGATASFGGLSTVTAVTGSNGIATAPALTANTVAGSYYAIASVSGVPASASFSLTNVAGAPTAITAVTGTPAKTMVNTPYTTALQAMVTDAYNNPVAGTTVTFSAPGSGASASFGGASTAAVVTNGSGIVFAPALTANSQAGSFAVTATAAAGVAVNFNLTNTAGGNGTLSGSANTSTSPVNLTAVGTADWIHWPDGNNKASGGNQLSNWSYAYTQNSNAQPQIRPKQSGDNGGGARAMNMGVELAYGDPRLMSWTDGNPTASSSNNSDGLYIDYGTYSSSGRSGFTFTAPADRSSRTLTFYAGGGGTGGTLTAHLSDGSAADYVDTTAPTANSYYRNYVLTYSAGSTGQTLTVTWAMSASVGNGNVLILGAALAASGSGGGSGGPTIPGTGDSTTTTHNLTSEGTADWVHWGDAQGNRKAGVTAQISGYSVIGSSGVLSYNNDPRALSWSDGTPAASGSNNNGVYVNSLGNGFSFTAPADTNTRKLSVHVGGWLSGGTLTATLSDGSVAAYTDTTAAASGQYDRNYTLTYAAGSAGQIITVTWVMTSGAGNVTLNGAALSLAGPSISAAAGSGQSAVVGNAFPTALQATVQDANNNPLSGVTVTFTAPSTGASGTFAGMAAATAVTNSAGIATAPALSANAVAGSYTVAASASGVSAPASFSLTNLAGAAAAVSATAGANQSAAVGTSFATALQATVKDAGSNPVSGVTVTFTAPATGASGGFAGSATATAVTNSSGVATAPVFTANGQAGGYTVLASVAGVGTAAGFGLTNLAGVPASVAATAGANQSMVVNGAFATALQATVKDAANNLLSGVTVTFTAPSTGASGTFAGVATATAVTNASGIATAPALTANSVAGAYSVSASVGAVSTSFGLTNVAGPAASITATAGANQSTVVNTAFPTALQATVRDASGNPVSGVTVTFTAPSSGAAGTFAGLAMAVAVSNSNGVATAPALTANSTLGSFSVTAAVSGVATGAGFGLTNNAVPINSAVLVQQAAGANFGNNQNTLTVTLGNAPGSGNVLILFFDQVGAAQTITSISGATWTRVAQNPAGNIGDSEVWVGTNPTSPAITITGTNYFGGFQPGYAIVAEFSGVSGTVDGAPQYTSSGIWPVTTANLVTANPGDLLLTSNESYNGGGSGATVNSPWTKLASTPGSYSLAAGYQTVSATGTYSATWNGSGSPQVSTIILALKAGGGSGSIAATAGAGQSVPINGTLATALQATVTDGGGHAVSGASVTFTAPSAGAGASFSGAGTATVSTNSNGVATAPALTANAVAGSYTVSASTPAVATAASFSLTNTAGPAASITAAAGVSQSAAVNTAFATALQATVKDAGNNPVSGAAVTFTAPTSGASGSFTGSATVLTNSTGVATAPALTANGQLGSYTVSASVAGVTTAASFGLTNTSAPPASVAATAGANQSVVVNNAFSVALQATVKDAGNNLLSGVTVTFIAPASGASGTFGGSASATAVSNASGVATAPAFTANTMAGSYAVSASAGGIGTSFGLTNVAGAAASIAATAGANQSTTVSTAFATALQATVKDAYGNPVSGVTVTFTAPSTGASASFGGSASTTATTNASGVATASTLTANAATGSYNVTASASGVGTGATFAMTNHAVPVNSAALVQQAAGANPGNNQTTLTVTLPGTPGGSNLLILFFNQISAAQNITSISGATWKRVAQNNTNSGDSEVWVGTNPTSPVITISGTNYFGVFQPGYAIVAEFSGVSATVDGSPGYTTSGFWPVTTASLTTANAGDLLITANESYNGGGTGSTINSPWTALAPPGGTYSLAAGYQIVTAAGTYAATWNGFGSPQVSTIILALKAGGY